MKFNIENYESMTPEEKVAALEAYEPDMSGYVAKATFDRTASEAASYKKQLREKMTEDEAQKAREAEEKAAADARVSELEAQVQALKAEKAVNGYTNSYLALGYAEDLAKSSAKALAKGDMETVFKNQKAHAENLEKALRTELLKQTPPPASGNGGSPVGKEAFAKMSLPEKQKFATENPEIYASFYRNKED